MSLLNIDFISQTVGLFLLVLGISFIFNHKHVIKITEHLLKNESAMWISGIISLIISLSILTLVNYKTSISNAILFILAILSFLKALYILWFPKSTSDFYKRFHTHHNRVLIYGIIYFILGILLLISNIF